MAKFNLKNNQGYIRQLNVNDTAGELIETFNIDLHTNLGKVKLARPLKQVATATQIGNETIQGFATTGTPAQNYEVYAITESDLFEADVDFDTWTSVGVANVANAEDCVVFQGQLVISTTNNLDAYDFSSTYTSDWWTARGNPTLTTNSPVTQVPRVVEVARIGSETLVVLDGSNVHAYVGGIGSGAVTNLTMDLDSSLTASCFKSSIRRGWIGTYTEEAEQAFVIDWDVASTNYTQAFPVGSRAVLAMELVNDVPLIVNELGEIKLFNNAGFTTIAQFPFAGNPTFADQSTNPNNINRPIHPKGIRRQGNTVYIYVNWSNKVNDNIPMDENTHNGLWALDLTTYSLTHLASQNNNSVFGGLGASPLLVLNDPNARIFLGGDLNQTADEEGIWIEDLDDDTVHYGHFTTTEMEAGSVADSFDEIIIKALLGADDKIVVKYRVKRVVGLPIITEDVVWASTTQFNTTNDLSLLKTRFDEGHFDEVEVLNGSGAGRLAHITDVSKSSSTYTVTIDTAIGIATETATVRFDNWKKIDTEYTSADGNRFRVGIGEPSTFCQVRCELQGKAGRPEIRDVIIKSNNKESA